MPVHFDGFGNSGVWLLGQDLGIEANGPVSMGAWIWPENSGSSQHIIAIVDSIDTLQDRFSLQTAGAETGDPIRAQTTQAGGHANADTPAGYDLNQWQFVAGTFSDGGSFRAGYLYKPYVGLGTLYKGTNSDTKIPSPWSGHQASVSGAWSGSGLNSPFEGCIAYAFIFDYFLEDADILEMGKGVLAPSVRQGSLTPNLKTFLQLNNVVTAGNNSYGPNYTVGSTLAECADGLPPVFLPKAYVRWI